MALRFEHDTDITDGLLPSSEPFERKPGRSKQRLPPRPATCWKALGDGRRKTKMLPDGLRTPSWNCQAYPYPPSLSLSIYIYIYMCLSLQFASFHPLCCNYEPCTSSLHVLLIFLLNLLTVCPFSNEREPGKGYLEVALRSKGVASTACSGPKIDIPVL